MADLMQNETWQHLLGLESVDIVFAWHRAIHKRDLGAKRANEITSSAKQAREYFRNAAVSDTSVKPLLTFYGVASLARATLLLLKRGSGEESLARGHGLETIGWSNILSGDLVLALQSIDSLRVRTCTGLFNDFVRETDNRMCMHTRSSSVDWRLGYDLPPLGKEILFNDLIATLPDLRKALYGTPYNSAYAAINELSYSEANGFLAKVNSKQFESFQNIYMDIGYEVSHHGELSHMKCSSQAFEASMPQFMHAYVNKMFGSIPDLNIAKPLDRKVRYSQLAITYVLSYFLGMLTRYFPTHWIALHRGAKGDGLWPAVHAVQKYVEIAFPELIIEFIHDFVDQALIQGGGRVAVRREEAIGDAE